MGRTGRFFSARGVLELGHATQLNQALAFSRFVSAQWGICFRQSIPMCAPDNSSVFRARNASTCKKGEYSTCPLSLQSFVLPAIRGAMRPSVRPSSTRPGRTDKRAAMMLNGSRYASAFLPAIQSAAKLDVDSQQPKPIISIAYASALICGSSSPISVLIASPTTRHAPRATRASPARGRAGQLSTAFGPGTARLPRAHFRKIPKTFFYLATARARA